MTLEFGSLRNERAYFGRTVKQLLSDRVASRYKGPECFFLADEEGEEVEAGYLHPDEAADQPAIVTNYLSALGVVQLLTDVADTSDDRTLVRKVFMTWSRYAADATPKAASRGTTIEIRYDADDLVPIDHEQLDRLVRLMTTDRYRDQTRQIFKNAVCRHVDHFPELLGSFDAIYRDFDADNNLFLSQFSFERFRHEAEALRLDYTAKLNDVFASIQNKLLAVPLAVVVVASQMKNDDDATIDNGIVLLGAAVFAFLMWLLVANQRDTLEVLSGEIARERRKVETYPDDIRGLLDSIYDELDGRHRAQRVRLIGVSAVVALAFLVPLLVFVYYEYWPN